MGLDINKSEFSPLDFSEFSKKLRKETAVLLRKYNANINKGPSLMGIELECWLMDECSLPAEMNQEVLAKLNHPDFVSELSQYNLEINLPPMTVGGDCFEELETALLDRWNLLKGHCSKLGLRAMINGSIPTLQRSMLNLNTMSQCDRYLALNSQIMRLRKDKPITLRIEGRESIHEWHDNVMLEAAATSLQIHHMVDEALIPRQYNASVILSPIMVALAANTPFVFGKQGWDESRIPIMEQSLSLPGVLNVHHERIRRVTLGNDFIRKTPMELFIENLDAYPVLLPIQYQEDHHQLKHLNLHNGSIWRWNRLIIQKHEDQNYGLRVEHRCPSAGPTMKDMVANTAFYIGLSHSFMTDSQAPEDRICFQKTRENLYQAARNGLHSEIQWLDGEVLPMAQLIEEELIPKARAGLKAIGVSSSSIHHYIDEVILPRCQSLQNGSEFQKKYIEKHPGDLAGLCEIYYKNQESNIPVHRWGL